MTVPFSSVLLVDDDEDDFELTRTQLEVATGGRVVMYWAPTFERGAQSLLGGGHDVALIDYQLGAMNGVELVRRVRNQGCTLPLVMLTGTTGRRVDQAAIDAGADDYLVKGEVTPAALERSLRYAIEHRAALTLLQHREEHLSALIANSVDVIALLDRNGQVSFISDAVERMAGQPGSFFVGRSGLEQVDPSDRPHMRRAFRRALHHPGKAVCTEFRARHADGTVRHREATLVNHLDNPAVKAIVVNCHDVTEKRVAATQQAHLAAIVESSDDAIFSQTAAGVITSWNAGAERLFGYTTTESVGAYVGRLVPEEFAHLLPALFAKVERGESIHQREIDCVRKDGCVVPVVLNISPLRQRDGTITGASTVAHDITQRRRVQAALSESESVYRSTFDEAPVGIAHTSLDGRWLRVNERLRSMLNYSREELLATTFAALTHPDDVDVNTAARRQLLAGEISHYLSEKRYRRGGGDYFWVNLTVSLHRDKAGTPLYFIAVVEDISERKRAQLELDHIFNLSPDMICTASFDGFLTRINARWSSVLGYTLKELQSRPFLEFVHPDDQASTQREMALLSEGQTTFGFTNRYRAADGTYRWIEWHAAADLATEVIYAVARDHTERRLLEQQLRQSQKMEAIGRLAGGVAHDFNNLLTAILGFSEMAMDQLGLEDPLRADLQQIVNAGQSAASLTRQLLAFSRKQILEPQVLDLNALITNMQSLLRRLIGEDVALVTTLGDNMARVFADRGQIEQVVMNLAVNARDAMPLGGTLSITTVMCDIDEAFRATHAGAVIGRHTCVTLSDNGTGMTADVLSHLFEPFFTTKPQGTGTGLGLATVYGIVKQSGGYIAVDSTPNVGTSFKVYLPIAAMAAPVEPPATTARVAVNGTETVLLAEDQKEVRDTASQALQRHGYRVLEAADGFAALALVEQHHGRIDLLITDVVMPQMSGRELADRLGAIDPTIPILYTSGYTDDAIVRHGVLEPGIEFLQKPFKPLQLLARVRKLLDQPRRASMMSPVVRYSIDREDVIVACGGGWTAFAVENNAPHLVDVVGRSLWEFVADSTTRQLYRDLLARARQGHIVRFSYRCDAPLLKRFMHMTMTASLGGGVMFESITVNTETRTPTTPPRDLPLEELLRICGWCKQVAIGDHWEEVDFAVDHFNLFADGTPPRITHTMCPACLVRTMDEAGVA